ncbi:hypothetical protein P3X46_021563 [Hevea brasiliensis]|uniref:PGG domain-containing protein n=1 Tax=Hevea brasiliensis TaxID=3981 RepID=A0ABQ9LJX6_HEVBR|nr:hypothetical protein P3X46_021563 [Hevea brasiliensis]
MDMLEEMKEVYCAISDRNWDGLINYYKRRPEHLLSPVNINGDRVFHLALNSKKKKPFEDLLEIVTSRAFPENTVRDIILTENEEKNNILHEAAIVGNFEVINFLVDGPYKELVKKLLGLKNVDGEVPLFTAAAFGRTKIVKFLASQEGQIEITNKGQTILNKIAKDSRKRYVDGKSILQIAMEGQHFETPKVSEFEKGESRPIVRKTALHVLADMPSAFWSGYTVGNIFEYLVYFFLDHKKFIKSILNFSFEFKSFKFLAGRIWEEKRKHKFALQLAKRLIRNTVWVEEFDSDQFNWSRIPLLTSGRPSPLFIAIKTGILEIVSEIIDAIPQYYVDLRNNKGQSILHWAVMYRREEIFDLLKDKGMSWDKMARKIDDDGNTLLHLVADTKHYTGGTKPGPALQLQEELQWFDRVKSVVPSYYPLLRAKMSKECQNGLKFARVIAKEEFKNPLTPRMLFELTHKKQLEEAQTWIKETSQSCSTVAALVATVVFAAAYTVPGGVNERGFPVFLRAPYFIFFTVMDVIALAFSLTSVVAFLSILTSPFEFDDFRRSIPWKLNFGFILLFFSVISAMLAFGATILLVIRSEKEWTTSLISIAAFFPVSVFTILQIHLYRTLIQDAFETAWKILPCFGMFSQSRARKQH